MTDTNLQSVDLPGEQTEQSTDDNPLLRRKIQEQQVKDYESLEKVLSEIPDGHKMAVTRVKPRWCEGHIETITIYHDESGQGNISADDLKERYGGEQLALRFMDENGRLIKRKTVTFANEPPRENGVVLITPDEKAERKEAMKHDSQAQNKMMDLVSSLVNGKGLIVELTPRTRNTLKIFEPTTFPTAISTFFL